MRCLQDMVNLVPVVAKADSLTRAELQAKKARVSGRRAVRRPELPILNHLFCGLNLRKNISSNIRNAFQLQ